MEALAKGIMIGTAVVVAVVTLAVEWWQYRQVPTAYSTHGQRRRD